MAAGAPGDLAEFRGIEAPVLPAVELAVAGEGDVIDVQIEAHADRIGGDDVFHVAVLIKRDLGIARARAERAEHDRRAAALPANEFGDRIDLFGRKGDDGAPRRQAR